jgi:hypothetical protein
LLRRIICSHYNGLVRRTLYIHYNGHYSSLACSPLHVHYNGLIWRPIYWYKIELVKRRSFIRKSKHQKHPNNVIIEGRFGIVVPKATTAVSNFLTTCAVVNSS